MLDKKGNSGLNYNYQVAVDSKNGMIVGQYLTQSNNDNNELFEMLHEIKIEIRINPKLLIIDNRYMNDNTIKYAFKNNIRSLIPDRNESSKTKQKNKEKLPHKVKFVYNWKTDTFPCQ